MEFSYKTIGIIIGIILLLVLGYFAYKKYFAADENDGSAPGLAPSSSDDDDE